MCLDDLKTTLGLHALRCLSPEMVRRELLMLLIAHNLASAQARTPKQRRRLWQELLRLIAGRPRASSTRSLATPRRQTPPQILSPTQSTSPPPSTKPPRQHLPPPNQYLSAIPHSQCCSLFRENDRAKPLAVSAYRLNSTYRSAPARRVTSSTFQIVVLTTRSSFGGRLRSVPIRSRRVLV